jgi:hypothetical protein
MKTTLQSYVWATLVAVALATVALGALADVPHCRAMLAKLPVAHVDRDEPADERAARLDVIEDALEGMSRREQALVLATWFGESKLAKYVRDDCSWRPEGSVGHCDHGTSKSYGQLKIEVCPELWDEPSGSDAAVRAAAKCTVRQLRYGMRRCNGDVRGAIEVYAGQSCSFTRKSIEEKLRWFEKLNAEVR